MNKPLEILSLSKGNYIIKGDLTFSTIDKSAIKALKFEQSDTAINIDLQQLRKIDSAGLALLIEWIKFARTYQIDLKFEHIPAQLFALAKLCDMTEIDLFTLKNT
ncbi:anti-anti-sigma factor [Methylococcaceae bacterium CS5]|nr:STAS domain-containing protein [Methyloprofundus sp.]TXK98688.1 anti-anti-sigma factor [Methylococcaceae bacterium CS5]TXL07376.1 anti-anti-sigma factor [Methylococcaceae bacterium CS3]TXL09887.1 anti-anti-sigma factor [Methylococcaceae bacterium CS2]